MKNMKIIMVDDNIDFLKVVGDRIKSWGYDLTGVTSGKEALKLIKPEEPCVVILDYKMPDMNGLSTLKEIRKINPKMPVIMFTAYPTEDMMKDTEKLGINAFIPKLSSNTDILKSLKAALDMIIQSQQK
ncbi:MAG: response regulator [Candidatus Omnitrophica bacterium]|jgi:sodium-dependent dicarboxylate transporter 2/3/5|nr:response regulator [Candidatus Omnitrophota bacterium]